MNADETACVQLLLEMFFWPVDDKQWQYKALTLLRKSRGQDAPTFDDFVAGTVR